MFSFKHCKFPKVFEPIYTPTTKLGQFFQLLHILANI